MSLTPELMKIRDEVKSYAKGFGLDFFEVIFELVSSDQINALAAMGGFPVRYPHWRFGMDYDQMAKGYEWGLQKIYEMVINTDPAYAYLMASNSNVDQKIVMAHVYGHVDFFKNNTWFSKTNRKMLDTMANHGVKVRTLMEKHGQDKVEAFIDRCLAIESLIDPQLPFQTARRQTSEELEKAREDAVPGRLKSDRYYMDQFINPAEFVESQKRVMAEKDRKAKKFPNQPMKDVLLFLMENAPLDTWEYECLSIVREEAYYFLPQMQTKIMNEGWASYWHSRIMTEKALGASEIVDFSEKHAGIMATQPGRVNPYKVGIELLRDVEDRWNRGKFGKEYDQCDSLVEKAKWNQKLGLGQSKIFEVRKVCNDITFIDEYLTEEFVERLNLYTYNFNRRTNQYEIADRDFKKVKEKLLFQLTNQGNPWIYVTDGNFENRGELLLWHKHQGIDLDIRWARETMKALFEVWRRPVNVETLVDGQRKLLTLAQNEFTEKFLS